MTDSRRVYRPMVRRSLPAPALVAYAVPLVFTFVIVSRIAGLAVAALAVLGELVLFAALIALALRPRTTVTAEGIDVRGVFETRRFPWSDIRGIAVARASMPGVGPDVPRVVVDAADVRVHLPNVNARQLGDEAAVDRELAALRTMWARSRGAGTR